MIIIKGICVDSEKVSGIREGRKWTMLQLFVLTGRDVFKVRVPDDYDGPLPGKMQACLLTVRPNVWNGSLSFQLIGAYAPDDFEGVMAS